MFICNLLNKNKEKDKYLKNFEEFLNITNNNIVELQDKKEHLKRSDLTNTKELIKMDNMINAAKKSRHSAKEIYRIFAYDDKWEMTEKLKQLMSGMFNRYNLNKILELDWQCSKFIAKQSKEVQLVLNKNRPRLTDEDIKLCVMGEKILRDDILKIKKDKTNSYKNKI